MGFGVTLAFLILVTILAVSDAKRISQSEQWVAHSYEVIGDIEVLVSQLKDAETGQRGYLLTDNKAYLAPYNQAIINLPLAIFQVKQLTLANSRQQIRIEKLQKLFNIKMLELDQTINLHRAGNSTQALQIVKSNVGNNTMNEFRALAREMRDEERILLGQRKKQAFQALASSAQLIYGATVLTFLIVGIVAILTSRSISTELSRLKATEGSLAISNQELQSFIYRTSHDFKSPLLGIKSMVSFIEEDIKLGNIDESLNNIDRINKNIDATLAVVASTLRLVKTDLAIMQIETVRLSALTQDVFSRLEGFAGSRGVEIRIGKGITGITIDTDITHLFTIVENLVSNGVKYSKDGEKHAFVQLDAYTDINGSISITVADNGLGIPQKYQKQVFGMFKQFHRGRANGTGLGLYIVRKSVDRLNGSIRFNSSDDGSLFTVNLPKVHGTAMPISPISDRLI
jgi:signal transduction histidine kinase